MMNDDDMRGFTQTSQIIIGSLAAGVIMFWVIITLVLGDGPGAPAVAGAKILGLPPLTAVSVLFGAVSVVASILIPRVMVDSALARMGTGGPGDLDAGREPGTKQVSPGGGAAELLPVYQTQLIVASALNEGAAFFAGIAYMIEHHAAAILVAGVLLALLLSRFPTAERIQAWLSAQLERLAAKRRDDF
jgi:hypothetical protein